jgi:hypothetical protein
MTLGAQEFRPRGLHLRMTHPSLTIQQRIDSVGLNGVFADTLRRPKPEPGVSVQKEC